MFLHTPLKIISRHVDSDEKIGNAYTLSGEIELLAL